MPRYYFDFTGDGQKFRDVQGTELADLDEAGTEAVAALAVYAKDELPDGDCRDFQITVREENGMVLLTATLSLRVERLCL